MTGRKLRLMTLIDEFTRSPPSLWVRFTATERRERGAAHRADQAHARRSMQGTLHHRSGAKAARCTARAVQLASVVQSILESVREHEKTRARTGEVV